MCPIIQVHDVEGDGNCFYRCLYAIIRNDPLIKKSFSIPVLQDESPEEEENNAVQAIRNKVADAFFVFHDRSKYIIAKTMIQSLIDLLLTMKEDTKEIKNLQSMYPLVSCVRRTLRKYQNTDVVPVEERKGFLFLTCMNNCARVIREKPICASSIEIDIVRHILEKHNGVHLAIISDTSISPREKQERWVHDLRNSLMAHGIHQKDNMRVALMINCDNVHYMYASFVKTKNGNPASTLFDNRLLFALLQKRATE